MIFILINCIFDNLSQLSHFVWHPLLIDTDKRANISEEIKT